MTRTEAAQKLLQHGPLKFSEFQAITGWPAPQCSRALKNLSRTKRAATVHKGRYSVWRLV